MQRTFKIMSKVSGAILAALIVFFVVLGVSLILPKLFGFERMHSATHRKIDFPAPLKCSPKM